MMAFEDSADRRQTDEMKTVLALHAIAIDGMADGLCVLDSEFRVVLFNRRYLEILGLPPASVKVGASLRAILEQAADNSFASSVYRGEMWRDLEQIFAQRKSFELNRRTTNGALVRICFRPVAGGAWVTTCEPAKGQHVELELMTQANRLYQAFANSSRGFCVYDAEKRLLACNDQYLQIYGFDRGQIRLGMSYKDILVLAIDLGIYTDVAPQELDEKYGTLFKNEPTTQQLSLSDGRTVQLVMRPTGSDGWIAEYEDITVRVCYKQTLHKRNELLDAALEHMAHGLCAYDKNMRVIVVNRRYLEMYGLTEDDARPGTLMLDLMNQSVARGVHCAGTTAEKMYSDLKHRLIDNNEPILHRILSDGRIIAVRHRPMANGGWVGTYEDITERHRAEENIAHMARHDVLTKLPNRLLFYEKMADGLGRVDNTKESMAIMCLDLDNFKAVNDSLGHPTGDKLLQKVAHRLCGALEGTDTIARLGGDEFAILHPVKGPHDAEVLARHLINAVSEPIVIDGQEINTGISIGIAVAPENGKTSDHLMKCADLALYRAKAQGRNAYRFFEPAMDVQLQMRRALETDLRRALAAGEFHLAYQPQIHLATNELVGIEALLRWTHPEHGPVSPAEFIPVAEEIGLIIPLGQWVLRQACSDAAKWPSSIRIAVNLSPVQFRGRGLVSTVTQTLAAVGLSAHRLELEITEAVLMQKDETNISTLHQLRALGVRIAMDDFGTGYSSLSYLRNFPFDKIKIDRSFLFDNVTGPQREAIIRTISELGSILGIDTTAEGIETDEQLQLVRRAGCTEGQGYVIGRPCSVSQILDLITRSQRNVAAA
jgi:diguanylate cyclase (GGDEF)-like protein/PAS domain S-box-containing protein